MIYKEIYKKKQEHVTDWKWLVGAGSRSFLGFLIRFRNEWLVLKDEEGSSVTALL